MATVSGVAIFSGDGAPPDEVVLLDWQSPKLIAIASPSPTGQWSADIGTATVFGIVYRKNGCPIAAHGPYTSADAEVV